MFFTFTTATCKKKKESCYESEFNTWCDGEADDERKPFTKIHPFIIWASRQQEKEQDVDAQESFFSDHTNTDTQNSNQTDVNKQFRL